MQKSILKSFLYLSFLSLLISNPALLKAEGQFSQINMTFDSVRTYSYYYDKQENSLVLEIQKTSSQELDALKRYDESLVRRILVKELNPQGCEVRIVLKNRKVRATVTHYNEPFRIAVDLYDSKFRENVNPENGFPLLTDATGKESSNEPIPGELLSESAPASPINAEQQMELEAGSPPQRRLLQPTPEMFEEPGSMMEAMQKLPEGRGNAWDDFPVYVYRLQTAAYESKKTTTPKSEAEASQALTSSRAMAEYAARFFDAGHESRALLAYQQVLFKEPKIFDENVLHLWRFSEANLASGNLALADGYFQSLQNKFPENALFQFAGLRRLDIAAIRLVNRGSYDKLADLLPLLLSLKAQKSAELNSQIAIRKAYWSEKIESGKYDKYHLPKISDEVRISLENSFSNIESQKTAFLAASLLLNNMLKTETPWDKSIGVFAAKYFERFSGKSTDTFRETLKKDLYVKLNSSIQKSVDDKKYLFAIQIYEELPKSLKSINKNPETSWSLAEAYRNLGQQDEALTQYKTAAKNGLEGQKRFQAMFWTAYIAADLSIKRQKVRGSQAQIATLQKEKRTADQEMAALWRGLNAKEQHDMSIVMKPYFEEEVSAKTRLSTPAKILLEKWSTALEPAVATAGNLKSNEDQKEAWKQYYNPSSHSVLVISNMAKRFAELGMNTERKKSLSLLAMMKPKDFEKDQEGAREASDIWKRELTDLAEEHRKANEWLEAGRIYTLTADEGAMAEKRAESLYKGGLLLYRAGQRKEAIDAFRKASEDGNNLFYSNLAKERLSQIEEK